MPLRRRTWHSQTPCPDEKSPALPNPTAIAASPGEFSIHAKPWIDAELDAIARTVATIQFGPSRTWADGIDGVPHEDSVREPGIRVTKHGP